MTRYKGGGGAYFACAYDKMKDAVEAQTYEALHRWNDCAVLPYELVEKKRR